MVTSSARSRRRFRRLHSKSLCLFLGLVTLVTIALPADLLASDLAMRRLAAEEAPPQTVDQARSLADRASTYATRWRDQIAALNTLTGTLVGAGTMTGVRYALVSAAVATGVVPGGQPVALALSTVAAALTAFGVKNALDEAFERDVRHVLVRSHLDGDEFFEAVAQSEPGSSERAGLVVSAIDRLGLDDTDLTNEDRGALAAYRYRFGEYVFGADLESDGMLGDIGAMDESELRDQLDAVRADLETTVRVGREIENRLQALQEVAVAVNELTNTVNEGNEAIQEKLDDGARRDEITQQLIYQSLPVSARIEVLANQEFLPSLSSDDRSTELERLKELQRAEQLRGWAEDTYTIASSGINILSTLAVIDEDEAGTATNIVTLGTSAAITVASFYAGNVPGIVTGISTMVSSAASLLGGGETRDAEDRLATALLEGQRELLLGQHRLMNAIRTVHAEVLANRRELTGAIAGLNRDVAAGFLQVQGSLRDVRATLAPFPDIIVDASPLRDRLNRCQDFLARRDRAIYGGFVSVNDVPSVVRFPVGEFETWDGLRAHYENEDNSRDWRGCWEGIRSVFAHRQIADRVADLYLVARRTSARGGPMLTDYIEPGVVPLVALTARHYRMANWEAGAMQTFCALLNSPLAYSRIGFRGHLHPGDTLCAGDGSVTPLQALQEGDFTVSEWLLDPDVVLYTTYLMMDIMPYYQMVDANTGALAEAEDIAYGGVRKPRESELEVLETAYRLVSLAIAQQTLLSGDVFLPVIHGYLFGSGAAPGEREKVIRILEHNPVLAHNYLAMQLRRELVLQGSFVDAMARYRTVFEDLSTENTEGVGATYEELFASTWEFAEEGNWVILRYEGVRGEKHETRISMPRPESIQGQRYMISPEYADLIALRVKLIDYAFRSDLDIFGGRALVQGDGFMWH
ncbi:MAG: hypothetical protein F4X11_22055 [Acidobacteria bacterium]|nr:hypothetical protein [Acidobacteriota bacterium]